MGASSIMFTMTNNFNFKEIESPNSMANSKDSLTSVVVVVKD